MTLLERCEKAKSRVVCDGGRTRDASRFSVGTVTPATVATRDTGFHVGELGDRHSLGSLGGDPITLGPGVQLRPSQAVTSSTRSERAALGLDHDLGAVVPWKAPRPRGSPV